MKTMMIRRFSVLLSLALVLGSATLSLAEGPDTLFLTPAENPTLDDLAGSTHRLYIEPGGKGWMILFRSAEVAARAELGNFNGVWLPDEKTSSVKVFRFDTQEGVALKVFTAPTMKGLVIGYRLAGKEAWHFLLPEKAFLENPAAKVAALQLKQ